MPEGGGPAKSPLRFPLRIAYETRCMAEHRKGCFR